MQNKRGQGLSTNAIILIVLGVIVLVILAIGFMAGWEKIAPWIKPSNNVQTIVDACSMACSVNSVYDYCNVKRELNAEDETLKDATCYYLSKNKKTYGIRECFSLCEATVTLSDETDELTAKSSCKGKNEGYIVQYLKDKKLEHYSCKSVDLA